MDWVHGLPTDWSTDYPYECLYGPPHKQKKNENATYCVSKRSLMWAKFGKLHRVNVTHLGSVSSASYAMIADHYVFAIFFAVALHEKLGSLRNLCLLFLHHFVQPALS